MAGFSLSSGFSGNAGFWSGFSGLWSGAAGFERGGGSSYSPEALAYFAAMTTQPSDARKSLLNTLINTLVSDGVWAKLDWLTIHAAHDAQAARVNAITPSQVATTVNSPTFTTDRGYTGDGATSYLNTGWNPTTAVSPKFVQNSCHLGFWLGTTNTAFNSVAVGNIYARLYPNAGPVGVNNIRLRPETSFDLQPTSGYTNSTAVGHTSWSRTAAAAYSIYKNGASVFAGTTASTAVPNSPFLICASDNATTGTATPANYSALRVQAAHFGSQLSDADDLALYNALATYMTAIGA